MLTLEVAATPQKRAPHEQVTFGRYVEGLVADTRFAELMTRTADEVVHEWSVSQKYDQREAMWYTLQGVQRLLRTMQVEIEHGVAAARELEDEKAREKGTPS